MPDKKSEAVQNGIATCTWLKIAVPALLNLTWALYLPRTICSACQPIPASKIGVNEKQRVHTTVIAISDPRREYALPFESVLATRLAILACAPAWARKLSKPRQK